MEILLIALALACYWACARNDQPLPVTNLSAEDSPLTQRFMKEGYKRVWQDEFNSIRR